MIISYIKLKIIKFSKKKYYAGSMNSHLNPSSIHLSVVSIQNRTEQNTVIDNRQSAISMWCPCPLLKAFKGVKSLIKRNLHRTLTVTAHLTVAEAMAEAVKANLAKVYSSSSCPSSVNAAATNEPLQANVAEMHSSRFP